MKDETDELLVPDFLQDEILQPPLVHAAVVPLRQITVCVTVRGWGLHLAAKNTPLAVEPRFIHKMIIKPTAHDHYYP